MEQESNYWREGERLSDPNNTILYSSPLISWLINICEFIVFQV